MKDSIEQSEWSKLIDKYVDAVKTSYLTKITSETGDWNSMPDLFDYNMSEDDSMYITPETANNRKPYMPTFEQKLKSELAIIQEMLLSKNAKYGDSALNPLGVFSKGSATELIKVRIDDKLSRIKNETSDNEDTLLDLLGYLILLRMAQT